MKGKRVWVLVEANHSQEKAQQLQCGCVCTCVLVVLESEAVPSLVPSDYPERLFPSGGREKGLRLS